MLTSGGALRIAALLAGILTAGVGCPRPTPGESPPRRAATTPAPDVRRPPPAPDVRRPPPLPRVARAAVVPPRSGPLKLPPHWKPGPTPKVDMSKVAGRYTVVSHRVNHQDCDRPGQAPRDPLLAFQLKGDVDERYQMQNCRTKRGRSFCNVSFDVLYSDHFAPMPKPSRGSGPINVPVCQMHRIWVRASLRGGRLILERVEAMATVKKDKQGNCPPWEKKLQCTQYLRLEARRR